MVRRRRSSPRWSHEHDHSPSRPAGAAGDRPADGRRAARQPPLTDGPRVTSEQMRDLGRLRRSVTDRHIAGVAGGLARHLDIDPIIVRVALVVLVFFGGSGLLLYAAGWLLVPEEGTADQPLGLDERSRRIALIGAGVLAALAALGDWAGAFWFPWPVVIVALAGAVVPQPQPAARGPGHPRYGLEPHRLDVRRLRAPADAPGRPTPARPTRVPPTTRPPTCAPATPASAGPSSSGRPWPSSRIGIGTLGVIDAAGTDVPDAGYPALAMAVTGVMLVVGAFWGRAGGLILVGLIAARRHRRRHGVRGLEGTRLAYAPDHRGRGARQLRPRHRRDDAGPLRHHRRRRPRRPRHRASTAASARSRSSSRRGMDVSVDASAGVGQRRGLRPGVAAASTSSRTASSTAATTCPDMTIEVDLGIGQVTVREQ